MEHLEVDSARLEGKWACFSCVLLGKLNSFGLKKEEIKEDFRLRWLRKVWDEFKLYFNFSKPRMAIFCTKLSQLLIWYSREVFIQGNGSFDHSMVVSNHPDLKFFCGGICESLFPRPVKLMQRISETAQLALWISFYLIFVGLSGFDHAALFLRNLFGFFPNRIFNIHHPFVPLCWAKPSSRSLWRGSLRS